MHNSFAQALGAAFLWIAVPAASFGLDQESQFTEARRTLQQQLRSKQPPDRIRAIRKLQEFPIAEAVKMVQNALTDPADEVQEAAYRGLVKLANHQEPHDSLMLLAKKAVHHKDDGQSAAPMLAALLSSDLPRAQRDTIEFLDKVAASKNGVAVLITLADAIGGHHDKLDVIPLARLAKTKSYSKSFAIRRAVVHALTQIPDRDAIDALIGILPELLGEVQADAVEHLTQVTEQIFALESTAWQEWWKTAKDTFEYPSRSLPSPYRSVAITASDYYYGLPLFAERLVFVLDTSGSMTGQRIAAAKRELAKAIANLPPQVSFGLVIFNGNVDVWQSKLVPANQQSKRAATVYVNAQGTHSNTASYDALETAMNFDTEAIYFLSDGAPAGGKITAPVDIIAAITAINNKRRISIYTIGVGAGFPGSPLDIFLKTLAEKNLGLYRRVDE